MSIIALIFFIATLMGATAVTKTYTVTNPTSWAVGTGVDEQFFFENYTINDTTSSVLMEVRHGNLSTYNVSIPSPCLDYVSNNILQLRWFASVFSSDGGWRGKSYFQCIFSSGWLIFSSIETGWNLSVTGAYSGFNQDRIVDNNFGTESFYYNADFDWEKCGTLINPNDPCVYAQVYEDTMHNTIVCDPSYICDEGSYVFEPNGTIYPSAANYTTGIRFNYSVSSNPSDWDSPIDITQVELYFEWLKDGVPTTCDGACEPVTINITNTSMLELDFIDGSFLDPDSIYTVNLTAVMTNGSTYGEEITNDAYTDPSGFPDPCGDGDCISGENAFSCAVDCGSELEGIDAQVGDGQIGTLTEYLNTGSMITSNGNIGVFSSTQWRFIFINRVVLG